VRWGLGSRRRTIVKYQGCVVTFTAYTVYSPVNLEFRVRGLSRLKRPTALQGRQTVPTSDRQGCAERGPQDQFAGLSGTSAKTRVKQAPLKGGNLPDYTGTLCKYVPRRGKVERKIILPANVPLPSLSLPCSSSLPP
jgi:hypothetical protein